LSTENVSKEVRSMEYKRYKRVVPEATLKSILGIKGDLLVEVQTVPKGTARPTDDGGTEYSTADCVVVSLYRGCPDIWVAMGLIELEEIE